MAEYIGRDDVLRCIKEREKYKQLKLNIDKSVKEIEQYLLEEECNGNHEKGILFALETFERNGVCKRNIGESE